jgi:hypothetical protein
LVEEEVLYIADFSILVGVRVRAEAKMTQVLLVFFCRNRSATQEAPLVTNKKTKRAKELQPQTDGSGRPQRGMPARPK